MTTTWDLHWNLIEGSSSHMALPRLFMRRSTVAVPGAGRGKDIPPSLA